jgi:hypothetical protein
MTLGRNPIKKIKVMSWKGKGSMKEGFGQIQSATGQRRYRTTQVDRRYNPVHHSVVDFLGEETEQQVAHPLQIMRIV